MTHPLPPDPDPLVTADRLAGALGTMTAQLKTVNDAQAATARYGHRNRYLIWLTFTSIALDIILTVLLVVGYSAAQATNARSVANAQAIATQHQNLLAACRTGNTFRAAQITLWDHVLSETATNLSLKTATGQQLLAYIRATFKPRDCKTIYRLP